MTFKEFLIKKRGEVEAENFPTGFNRQEIYDFAEEYSKEIKRNELFVFFTLGMEAVNCDNCGAKGTQIPFEYHYRKFINQTKNNTP